MSLAVIPANAGIHSFDLDTRPLIELNGIALNPPVFVKNPPFLQQDRANSLKNRISL